MRLIVGMTGATGAPLGIRLLEHLARMPEVETHLVLSRWARTTIELETGMSVAAVGELADVVHGPEDQGATIASGSFRTDGMVIVPCSMKTLAGIRTGYAERLATRSTTFPRWARGSPNSNISLPTADPNSKGNPRGYQRDLSALRVRHDRAALYFPGPRCVGG